MDREQKEECLIECGELIIDDYYVDDFGSIEEIDIEVI